MEFDLLPSQGPRSIMKSSRTSHNGQ
uniref:Uncharacterized protein n=1 Tax=Anguilla anguilla TaxID=7936 RepID=A0A0E9TH29_ANGAN